MDQDATWYGGRPRPRPHCVRWGPTLPQKGAQQPQRLDIICQLSTSSFLDPPTEYWAFMPAIQHQLPFNISWQKVYSRTTSYSGTIQRQAVELLTCNWSRWRQWIFINQSAFSHRCQAAWHFVPRYVRDAKVFVKQILERRLLNSNARRPRNLLITYVAAWYH